MFKRGLSDVVTTVLIILLALAAVGIIGSVIINNVQKSGEKIDVLGKCQELEINPTKCAYQGNVPEVTVQRTGGADVELANIGVILNYLDGSSNVFYPFGSAELPDVYQIAVKTLPVFTSGNEPISVRVAPWVKSSKGNVVGCSAGATISCIAGKVTSVLVLDGTNSLGRESVNGLTNDEITISFWARKEASFSGNGELIHIYKGLTNGVILFINNNMLNLEYYQQDGNTYISSNVLSINDDYWHHIVFTFKKGDNDLLTKEAFLFVDNLEIWRVDTTNSPIFDSYPSLSIGRNFQGSIDEIRIYKKVLTNVEVEQLYNAGTERNDALLTNPNILMLWYTDFG